MNFKFLRKHKNIKNLNFFIITVFFLLGFALLYFLYYRQRNQADLYVYVSVARLPAQSQAVLVPYWISESINTGDKDMSPISGANAIVLDKRVYDATTYGKYLFLLLKVKAIKDRSGIYLFENKPLLVGDSIDLKLTKAHVYGLVMTIGDQPPQFQYKKLKIKLEGKSVYPWVADSININSKITDGKGQEIAKIIGKKIDIAQITVNTASGVSLTSYDNLKRDIEVDIELQVKMVGNDNYFMDIQRIRVGEEPTFYFPDGILNFPIVKVDDSN